MCRKQSFRFAAAAVIAATTIAFGLKLVQRMQRESSVNDMLIVPIQSVPENFDPQVMEDSYSMTVVLQLYRGLFRYLPDGNVSPDLVASWTANQSKDEFVFRLHHATFSDGRILTASHVRETFLRLFLRGASMSADMSYLQPERIEVIDDQTLKVRLEHPAPLFFKHLAAVDCAILPIEDHKSFALDPENSSFSGPYRIASRTPDRLELEKWRKDQFDSAAPPARIVFVKMDNPDAVKAALKNEIDSIDNYPASDQEQDSLQRRGWKGYLSAVTSEYFIVLNPQHHDLEQRKNLSLAIDRLGLVDRVGGRKLQPAWGLIPDILPGSLSESDVATEEKPARADGVSVTLEFYGASPIVTSIAEYVKRSWEKIGYRVTLEPLPIGKMLSQLFEKKARAIIASKGLDYPDGFANLAYFRGGVSSNYFHLEDNEVNSLLSDLQRDFDEKSRQKKYRDLQIRILSHYTVVPLFFGTTYADLWSPRVAKVPGHPMGIHTLSFETIEMAR